MVMATSHYEVLGVSPLASPEAIRRAYRQRARLVHPDRQVTGGPPPADAGSADRAMQELNEAWRVLGDPARRAAYDQLLDIARAPAHPPAGMPGRMPGGEDGDDRPFPRRLAEPGDLGISLVRALPWAAAVVVLGAIFVFTAFAGDTADDVSSGSDLVGSCVELRRGGEVATVPCDGPNDGRVDLIAARSSLCPEGSEVARLAGEESWLCLRDPSPPSATAAEDSRAPR